MNRLSQGEATLLSYPIAVPKEIIDSISKINNRQVLTDRYYNILVSELASILCRVYNYALDERDPPSTWAEAIITVIDKEGKDPTHCTRHRPISLFGEDFKILLSILANRLQRYICKLVNSDQTWFISQ